MAVKRIISFQDILQKLKGNYSTRLVYIAFVIFTLFQYFGPISAYFFRTPLLPILGVRVDILWIALLFSTTATFANDLITNADLYNQIFGWFVLTSGIVFYQLFPAFINYLVYLGIVLVCSLIFFTIVRDSTEEAIQLSFYLTSVGGIFGVSSGLVSSYPIITTIYIGFIGIYLFGRWALRGRFPHQYRVGIGDRLYNSTINLIRSPSGVAIQSVIYLGLFTTTSIISGYVIHMFFSDLFTLSPKKFAINVIGFVFGIVFFILIFGGWLKALERAPYSARYLEGVMPGDLFDDMPSRQSLLALVLPSVGWAWTRVVEIDIQTHTPQVVGQWNTWIVIIYSLTAIIILLYSLSCWFKPIRRFIPLSRYTKERPRSLDSDIYYYSSGGLSLMVVNYVTSPTAAIIVFLATLLLAIVWKFGSDSKLTYLYIILTIAFLEVSLLLFQ